MSEHDSDLPDPRELFERMEREARESEREGSDGEELPDPEELFREMEDCSFASVSTFLSLVSLLMHRAHGLRHMSCPFLH